MNVRKRILLSLLILTGLLAVGLAAAAAWQQAVSLPGAGTESSCPTADQTAIPICAPGEAIATTPGKAPGSLGTPAGP
ncbi:MAG: hypothetical protein ACOYYS_18425 [Chloroflexota bacterium]